jgi:acetyl esterase
MEIYGMIVSSEDMTMPKITYTQEQLARKAARWQKMTDLYYGGKRVHGKERFLETDVGRVRVLCYGLENTKLLPLFVNIHGGGSVLGHPEMDDPFLPRVAADANIKIISVDYSLSPQSKFPVSLNECYAVIKYAQEHADEFGVDPTRIAVGGHSAGGNLSASICLLNAERQDLNLKAAILDYPAFDIYTSPYDKPRGGGLVGRFFLSPSMMTFFSASYASESEYKNPLVSPIYASSDQLRTFPPTLIITAGKDTLCKEAEQFRDMLQSSGVTVAHKRFEKSQHGFTIFKGADSREGWRLMIEHLRRYL